MLTERDLKNEGVGERVDVHVKRCVLCSEQVLVMRETVLELRATLDSFLENSMRKRSCGKASG